MLSTTPLLAVANDAATRAASSSWATMAPWVVGFVIASLVAVWSGVLVAEWLRRRQPRDAVRQTSLLDQLCQAHGLDAAHQQHLERIARTHARGDVVMAFIDPRILETAARETPELTALGQQLFGSAWQLSK